MTDQPQAQDEPNARAEREIQGSVETHFTELRAAGQQANPHGQLTVADEFEMRSCITVLERARRGLPLEAGKQQDQFNVAPPLL